MTIVTAGFAFVAMVAGGLRSGVAGGLAGGRGRALLSPTAPLLLRRRPALSTMPAGLYGMNLSPFPSSHAYLVGVIVITSAVGFLIVAGLVFWIRHRGAPLRLLLLLRVRPLLPPLGHAPSPPLTLSAPALNAPISCRAHVHSAAVASCQLHTSTR